MKYLKLTGLALAIVVILSQIPFAIGRWRIASLADQAEKLEASRKTPDPGGYKDLRGALHVHSFLGGHSTGTFDELIAGAKDAGLDFVVMTEHTSRLFDSSEQTLRGDHGGVLWIGGNETSSSSGERFLILPGYGELGYSEDQETKELLAAAHERGSAAIVAYPERIKDWNSGFDGIEVFSLNTNLKKANKLLLFFDLLWSGGAYPELTVARHLTRPDEEFAAYDRIGARREVALLGGNDAHSNLGIHLGDDSNNKWIEIKADRYESVFRLLSTRVLIPEDAEADQSSIIEALKNGRSYYVLETLGSGSGFRFSASDGNESVTMGGETGIGESAWAMKVSSPLAARLVLLRDGKPVKEVKGADQLTFSTAEPGAYRVEAYLEQFGSPFDTMPWLVSNPIFLRK